MKVFLHYEEPDDSTLHKTLKITLPKSWKNGPTSKLLEQFVESYNAAEQGTKTPLNGSEMHLAVKRTNSNNGSSENDSDEFIFLPLASDSITIDVIEDREAVYIIHGESETLQEIEDKKKAELERKRELLAQTVACVHFGCKKRFTKGGPYPDCSYHAAPPVFHETAKFWSCCPQKKAYDWDDFQSIKGCKTGHCTDVKEEESKQFLGGCDLREIAGETQKLKSIDDFNSAQAGGSDAAPILDRLKSVFAEIGIENELFDQVVDGIKKKVGDDTNGGDDDVLAATSQELGNEIKKAMKNIAVQQLRIK